MGTVPKAEERGDVVIIIIIIDINISITLIIINNDKEIIVTVVYLFIYLGRFPQFAGVAGNTKKNKTMEVTLHSFSNNEGPG